MWKSDNSLSELEHEVPNIIPNFMSNFLFSSNEIIFSCANGFLFSSVRMDFVCCLIVCLPIWLWNVVMNSGFIHCHISNEKNLFILTATKTRKQHGESWTRWKDTVPTWLQSFLGNKYSFKIVNRLPPNVFKMSAISRNFSFLIKDFAHCQHFVCTTACKLSIAINSSWFPTGPQFGSNSIFPHQKTKFN